MDAGEIYSIGTQQMDGEGGIAVENGQSMAIEAFT